MLFLRALVAFLALPGMVAFVVPFFLFRPAEGWPPFRGPGAILLAFGAGLLLWCIRDFYVVGKGTLAPWSPPVTLVRTGLYRASRNPMYVAVTLILWGWAVGFESGALAAYALTVMVAFQLRVVLGEEPWLEQTHGDEWLRYRQRVPRWIGRVR